jgi:hypothetical protein
MNYTIADAINSLCPKAQFIIVNGDYSKIDWIHIPEGFVIPTIEEIEEELKRLQLEYEKTEYQRLRAKAYPSFEEQFDLLYHGGYDIWKEEINKIKDMYPKPE